MHVGCGGDEVQPKLALQTVAGDLHVEEAEEATAEAEAQRHRGLRLVGEGCIVELQLVKCIAQVGVVGGINRVKTGIDHGLWFFIPGERFFCSVFKGGDGVAHLGLANVFYTGDEVAYFSSPKPIGRFWLGRDNAHFEEFVDRTGRHHADLGARAYLPIHHTNVGDDSTVNVVDGIEDEGAGGVTRAAGRGGHFLGDDVHEFFDANARLCRDLNDVAGITADNLGDFAGVALRLGSWQIDLVEDGDDLQILIDGHVKVCEGLRLNTLGGVDEKHSPFTCFESAGNLVGKVDVPGGVDEVHDDLLTGTGTRLRHPGDTHILCLNGDAALPLDIHAVQILVTHFALVDDTGDLQHAIGQRGLTVVDVGNDAEVTDPGGISKRRLCEVRHRRPQTFRTVRVGQCGSDSAEGTYHPLRGVDMGNSPSSVSRSGSFWNLGRSLGHAHRHTVR